MPCWMLWLSALWLVVVVIRTALRKSVTICHLIQCSRQITDRKKAFAQAGTGEAFEVSLGRRVEERVSKPSSLAHRSA